MNVKRIKAATIIVIILAVFSLLLYHKNSSCDVCGGCEYEKFIDRVKVKNIVFIADSIDVIFLKSIIDTSKVYQIDSYNYSVIEKDFDEKEIRDRLKEYTISGNRTAHGSCSPYSIQKMVLNKK